MIKMMMMMMIIMMILMVYNSTWNDELANIKQIYILNTHKVKLSVQCIIILTLLYRKKLSKLSKS